MKEFRILIIEDEKQMSQLLEMELAHEGYAVDTAFDGISGLNKLETGGYDLVLLDIMLPRLNGVEVCSRLRTFSDVPVIMLTAKGDIQDKVAGLDSGANDYLSKPFAIEELLARIRVYTRDGAADSEKNRIAVNDIVMDKEKHQVWRAGKEIELTKKEFDLLEMLLINKNIVLSREKLIDSIWGYEYEGEANVVDVFIRYLRSKLDEGFEKTAITTVRGVGYVIKVD